MAQFEQNDLCEKIQKRLTERGLNGPEFCQKLVEYQCLMAGSFPLQCLLNESYEDSDIDIFTKKPPMNQYGFNDYCLFEKWIHETYGIGHKCGVYIMHDVICSRKYQINQKTCVNIVLVDTDDLDHFVVNTFDLSFCQTRFDGQKLTFSELDTNKVGYIANRDGLKKRRHHHISEEVYFFHKTRWANDPAKLNLIYPDPDVILKRRLEKYRQRGFTIFENIDEIKDVDVKNIDSIRLAKLKNEHSDLLARHEKVLTELSELRTQFDTVKKELDGDELLISQIKTVLSLLSSH
jgi:hypothetical protein